MNKDVIRALAMFSQIGIVMFTTIAVSFAIGFFIDRLFDSSPIFIIIFLVLGAFAAIRNMIVVTKNSHK